MRTCDPTQLLYIFGNKISLNLYVYICIYTCDTVYQYETSGADPGFLERGFICIHVWGFALLIYLIFRKYSMKMK